MLSWVSISKSTFASLARMTLVGGGLNGSTQHPRETALPRLLAAESCRAVRKAGATMVSGDLAQTSMSKPAPEDTVLTGDRGCHWNQAADGYGNWLGAPLNLLLFF